jgi:CTP:molybdopterin cytidylyltransferase MocA
MSAAPHPLHGVAAVVLAAGESRRFGSPKQAAMLRDRTLLEHVLTLAARAGLDPIVAVIPTWLDRQTEAEGVRWVTNPHPERGMSESLQLGFAALPEDVGAALILLGDQPTLPASSIAAILARRGERPIVAARSGGHATPPVLVERGQFQLVKHATGDRGLRDVLRAHPDLVVTVAVPSAPDVDTPADLHVLDEGDLAGLGR